mmetsp:Transcript_1194/g.3893  ORF Transcript_1194/g.3893 Transcript_1194/m.3893 type:complete len:273 (+) Transcript_1194:689-1507(+)
MTAGSPASACHDGERRCSVDADGCAADGTPIETPARWRARCSRRAAGIGSPSTRAVLCDSCASSSRSTSGETATTAAGISAAALVSRSALLKASHEASGAVARTAVRVAPTSACSRRCTRCSCMISWLVVCSANSSGTRTRASSAADQWHAMRAGAAGVRRPSSQSTAGAEATPCARTSDQTTPARLERSTVHQLGCANHHHEPFSDRSSAAMARSSIASLTVRAEPSTRRAHASVALASSGTVRCDSPTSCAARTAASAHVKRACPARSAR